jgi:hypothetical protein
VDALLVDGNGGGAEMERHTVLFVEFANEIADIRPEYLFHGNGVRYDHVHTDIARTQRRRHLETDEAGADDHRPLRNERLLDQGARACAGSAHVRETPPGMSSRTGSAPVASSSLS